MCVPRCGRCAQACTQESAGLCMRPYAHTKEYIRIRTVHSPHTNFALSSPRHLYVCTVFVCVFVCAFKKVCVCRESFILALAPRQAWLAMGIQELQYAGDQLEIQTRTCQDPGACVSECVCVCVSALSRAGISLSKLSPHFLEHLFLYFLIISVPTVRRECMAKWSMETCASDCPSSNFKALDITLGIQMRWEALQCAF